MRIELKNGVVEIYYMWNTQKGEQWFKEIGTFPSEAAALSVLASDPEVIEALKIETMLREAKEKYITAYKVQKWDGEIVRINPRNGFYYRNGSVYVETIDSLNNIALFLKNTWLEIIEDYGKPIKHQPQEAC